MRTLIFLASLALTGFSAMAQVKIHQAAPLRIDKTQNSGSPTIQVLNFPTPKEIVRTFDIQSNSFYLMKGKIISMQDATNFIANKTATLCQVNLSRMGVSALSLANEMNVKNVAYFQNVGQVQASIDVESESILSIVVTRTVSPAYIRKVEQFKKPSLKEQALKQIDNFLKINANTLSDCFGTKVEVWEINRPN